MIAYQAQMPPPPRPSTGLKVLAIIQIIFGAFGVLGAPVSILIAILNGASKDPLQRKLHALLWEGPVAVWSYSQAVLSFVLAVLLIAGGIGVVRGKLWGRTSSLVYGAGSLASLLVGQIVMGVVVYPMLLDEMNAATSDVTRAGAVGGLVGGVGAAAFGAIFPLIVLIVLGRRAAREQLD